MCDLSEVLNVRVAPTLARGVRLTAVASGIGQSEMIREALREKVERVLSSPLISPDDREAILFEMRRPEAVAAALNDARRGHDGRVASVKGVGL